VLVSPNRRDLRCGFVFRCSRWSTPSDRRARLSVELVMGLDAEFVRAERCSAYLRMVEEEAGPGSLRGRSSSKWDEADDRPRERAERMQDRRRGPRLFFNGAGVLWEGISTMWLDGESGLLWQDLIEAGCHSRSLVPLHRGFDRLERG